MKYLFIISAILFFSCKKNEDPKPSTPAPVKYMLIFEVYRDASKGPYVDVILNWNGKVDTLSEANGGGYSIFKCYSTDVISFESENKMKAFVKIDDGNSLEENVYLSEDNSNYIRFELSTIR